MPWRIWSILPYKFGVVIAEIKVPATGFSVEFDKLMKDKGIYQTISVLFFHRHFITSFCSEKNIIGDGNEELFSLGATIFFAITFHPLMKY